MLTRPNQTTVMYLLFASCPAAILRAVVTVVVIALQCQSGVGLRPDITVEGKERISPAFAHLDSSSAVISEGLAFRVVTSPDHVEPTIVFGRLSESVCGSHGADGLFSPASAICGFAGSKAASKDGAFSSAFALTCPETSPTLLSGEANDYPSLKAKASQVAEVRLVTSAGGDRLDINHDVTLLNRVAIGQSRQVFTHLSRLASL